MFCKNCGARINQDSQFCNYCGAKITKQENPQQMPQQISQQMTGQPVKNKKGPKPWLIVVIVAAIVVVIAAAVFAGVFIYKSHNAQDKTNTERQDNSHREKDKYLAGESETDAQTDEIGTVFESELETVMPIMEKDSEKEKNALAITMAQDIDATGVSGSIEDMKWLEIQQEASWAIEAAQTMQLFDGETYVDISTESTAYKQSHSIVDTTILECGLRPYNIKIKEDIVVADVELLEVRSEAVSLSGLYRVVWRIKTVSDDTEYILVAAKKLQDDVQIVSASASSTLVDSADTSKYAAKNIYDHNMSTAWVEGASGFGEGESITLNLSGETAVHGIRIAPGYDKNDATISENATPVKIRLEFSDDSVVIADLNSGDYNNDLLCASETRCIINRAQYKLKGLGSTSWTEIKSLMDIVSFGKEIQTSWIKVTILDVKPGTDWEDTCISEISVY